MEKLNDIETNLNSVKSDIVTIMSGISKLQESFNEGRNEKDEKNT